MKAKKILVMVAVCVAGGLIIAGSQVAGYGLSKKQERNHKLQRIELLEKRINKEEQALDINNSGSTQTKKQLMDDLKEKTELEIETGTYDYKAEFDSTLATLQAGLTVLNNQDDLSKSEKEKTQELQSLYDEYSGYNEDNCDYELLNKQLNTKLNAVVEKYVER